MRWLRRAPVGSLKLCGTAGDWFIRCSSISYRRSDFSETRGDSLHCGCEGSRSARPLPHVVHRHSTQRSAALIGNYHKSVVNYSCERSGAPLLLPLTVHCECSKCVRSAVLPLLSNSKWCRESKTSGCFQHVAAPYEFGSIRTCENTFLDSEEVRPKCSLGFGKSGAPHAPLEQHSIRTGQFCAEETSWLKSAHLAGLTTNSCEKSKDCLFVSRALCCCSRHTVGNWRTANGVSSDEQCIGIRLPVLAMGIFTALVVPLKEEEVFTQREVEESSGRGVEDAEGSDPSKSVWGCILKRTVEALKMPVLAQYPLCTDAIMNGAAENLQEYISFTKHLMEYFFTEELDVSRKVSGNVLEIWRGLREHLALLAPVIAQYLHAVTVSSKRIYSIHGWGTQESDFEVLEAEMQHPRRKFQSQPTSTVAALNEAGGQIVSQATSRCTVSPAHAACQVKGVREPAAASDCSEDSEYLPKQLNGAGTGVMHHQPDFPGKEMGWIAFFARRIGSLFRTLASVCQRLFLVAPMALTAAIAGFWLALLPYIFAGLQLLGIESHRALHWKAVTQHELEEVIFTAITAAASAAGPTYVKFLQWIATRPDLFHESLCVRCARLQTAVPPFSYPRAALLLRDQFGDDVARYLVLDPVPIGCGCIAQVYRAYLLLSQGKGNESRRHFLRHAFVLEENAFKPVSFSGEAGKEGKIPPVAVAVKIMRPGVREEMEFDLRIMRLVASVVQCLPAFGFVAIKNGVEEFAVAMRRQLDFGLEEKHLKHFRENFGLPSPSVPDDLLPLRNRCRRTSKDYATGEHLIDRNSTALHGKTVSSLPLKVLGMHRQVSFPYPFEALSSSEVLVMTLEGGFTLNQLFTIRKSRQETKQPSPSRRSTHERKVVDESEGANASHHDFEAAPFSLAATKMIERFNSIGMICLHSFLQMVFLDNFFHGDMHSGNLLCRFARGSKEHIFPLVPSTYSARGSLETSRLDGPLELVVLDCGLAGSLSQADRVNFVTLLEAIAKKHGRDAAMAMLQRARRNACKDEAGFCSEVEKLILKHHFEEGNSLQMIQVRFTSLMGRMLSLSKKYCVELDPSFVSIVVAMSILEGVGAQLCPEVDVLKTAVPYSFMAAQVLGSAIRRES